MKPARFVPWACRTPRVLKFCPTCMHRALELLGHQGEGRGW
jgi:hypothetical protein